MLERGTGMQAKDKCLCYKGILAQVTLQISSEALKACLLTENQARKSSGKSKDYAHMPVLPHSY